MSNHKKLLRIVAVAVMAFITFSVRPVLAHPADMYFQAHTIHMTPDGVHLTWSLYLGPLLVPMVYTEIDQDGNQAVSDAEAQAWAEAVVPDFAASVGGTPLRWQIESVEWPESFKDFQVGNETILIEMQADWPADLSGEHQLKLDNQYQENISVNWFYLHGDEGVSFRKPVQDNGQLETTFRISADDPDDQWLTYWDSGTPSLPALASRVILDSATGESNATSAEANRPIAVLTDLVSSPDLSLPFYALALGIAVVLGALHSLTPGHGKTVVAAYLVGSKGTMLHAVSLGTIVTLTHTGSVFVLGLITVAASQYILPTSLFPILEIASGLLIIGLGASLLYQRWQIWQASDDEHHHDHHHHHHHHDHGHGHHHHHHVPVDAEGVSWRSLVTLGVSGGLVPCPDAIAILLVAVAINRVVLGLSLIVAFSLGLAVVLIFIGIVMVRSRRLFNKMDAFNRWAPLMPVASAIIVLALGLVLTVSAFRNLEPLTTSSESSSVAGLAETQIEAVPVKSFDLDQAAVLFMDGDEQGQSQVFQINLDGGQPVALTDNPFGVQGYTLSSNGKTVVYTAMRDDGGSDLWTIGADGDSPQELLACPNESCSGPVWSPDGQRLVYERINPAAASAAAGLPSLWWFEMESGETGPVFQDSAWPGFNPRWSPDGAWLSYVYPGSGKMELYRLADGRRTSVDTKTGAPVEWSPQGDALLVTNVWDAGERSLIHLFRYDVVAESLTDLSEISKPGDSPVMDSAGVWSPDGAWLVVVRRGLTEGGATSGSRLWLIRPDGSEARPLTEESDVIYGNPVWSPDGRYVLFHNYALAESLATKIFWLDVETGEIEQVVNSGSRPSWVP